MASVSCEESLSDDNISSPSDIGEDGADDQYENIDDMLRERGEWTSRWVDVGDKIKDVQTRLREQFDDYKDVLPKLDDDAGKKIREFWESCKTMKGKDVERLFYSMNKGHAERMAKMCKEGQSVVITHLMLRNMRTWHTETKHAIYNRICMKTDGGTLEGDVTLLTQMMHWRLKALLAICTAQAKENGRMAMLASLFPLLLCKNSYEHCECAWVLYARYTNMNDGNTTKVLLHSIQSLSIMTWMPVTSDGPEEDVCSDKQFRKFLDPEKWCPSFSSHLTHARDYYFDASKAWCNFDLPKIKTNDRVVSPCVIDVFTIALLALYSPQAEGDMGYADDVRVETHYVTNTLYDPSNLFREICAGRIRRRINYIRSVNYGYENDANELGLDAEPYDDSKFFDMNKNSFFSMIHPQYDDHRVIEDSDDDDDSNFEDVQEKDAHAARKEMSDHDKEAERLEDFLDKVLKTKYMRPVKRCPPSSIATVFYMPRKNDKDEHNIDVFKKSMSFILDCAYEFKNGHAYLKNADDLTIDMKNLSIDDSQSCSSSSSKTNTATSAVAVEDDD